MYYYVHDRLGSVRMVVGYDGQTVSVANGYAYRPFGAFYEGECVETVDSPFCFTGQWRDAEIDQYYLRAQQYDPAMMRFMARDPVRGDFAEPMTLHRYLYCVNNPVSWIDPTGAEYTLPNVTLTTGTGSTMDAIMGYTYGVIMNTSMGVIAGTIGGLTQILYGLYSGETYTDEEIMEIMATNVFVGAAGGAAFGLVSGPAAGYAAYSGGLSGAMVRGYIGAGIGQGLVLGYLDKMKKDKQTNAIVDMHLRSVYKNVQVLVVCNTWFES